MAKRTKTRVLQLAVKKKWFDLIKSGDKIHEYRLQTEYWRKRLEGRFYDKIVITLGYPPRCCHDRRLEFEYNGYDMLPFFTHEEWNKVPVAVYAISLERPINA